MDAVIKENKSDTRVDVNCEQKDGRTDGRKTGRLYRILLKQVPQKSRLI